jgi:hypothetical protein
MPRAKHALDIVEENVALQAQPENLRRGVAAVLCALTRIAEADKLWPKVWAELYDRQGIRNKHPRADGLREIDKQYNRVRELLLKAAAEHE